MPSRRGFEFDRVRHVVDGDGGDRGGGRGGGDGAAMEPVEGSARRRHSRVIQDAQPKGWVGRVWNGASAPTRAVRSLNLALYEGQVTGLLGPNGAGKSTTVAMLTGLTPPTEGDAIVAGHSLRGALADARRVLGVCPQMNVLFPSLTCAEHLRVYATPGRPRGGGGGGVSRKITQVGPGKGARCAETLSGGMKRRLQMAMALVGPSRVVLLDEPTSGLDPKSRRDAWRLIRAAAKGRAVPPRTFSRRRIRVRRSPSCPTGNFGARVRPCSSRARWGTPTRSR